MTRRSTVAALVAGLVLIAGARLPRVSADVVAAPGWRLSEGITTAIVHRGTVYVGGTFTQLFTPSTSIDQFYDTITGQPRTECARTTNPASGLSTTPDGQGGLLVMVHPDDAFADEDGPFVPPTGTTIVRIASTCRWDRAFAAPAIDPADANNLSVGLPVRVGNVIYASNSIIGPDLFLRAQVAAYDAVSGDRIGYQFYPGIAEIGLLGAGPEGPVARVRARDSIGGQFVLGVIAPNTLELTSSLTTLADESFNPKFWVRGTTLFRARPAPVNTLEAYDLTTLAPKAGWTAPVVPALADLEVVGSRVFLTSRTVNGQVVPQPSALAAATGAVDSTWTPPALTKRAPDPPGRPYTPVLTHLATDGQRLYFSGDMERVGGIDRDGVAALLVASASLDAWDPAPVLASPLEHITPGGLLMTRPTGAHRITRRYLAAIDPATGMATAWNPNDFRRPQLLHTVSPVSAIATDGTYLYFASASTGEVQRADLVTADVDQNWRFIVSRGNGQPGSIETMVESNGTVYVGGEFESIAGVGVPSTLRHVVAAVGTDGTLRGWAPALDGPPGVRLLEAMLPLGGAIYLGGAFNVVNGEFRLGFAAVDAVSHLLVQPEMFVLGDTRIRGLATDGRTVFVAGESFGAPLVGATAVPTSELTQFRVQDAHVPTSAAFVAGSLYAGLEYNTDALVASSRTTRWNTVVSGPHELLHITAGDGTLEYYAGMPGPPPGAPTLVGSVSGSVVSLAWTPSPSGGVPSSYTLLAGSAPGAADLAAFALRGATSFTTSAPDGGYFVRVVPRNRFGPGPPSNEVFLRVGPVRCTAPPSSPEMLAFTVAGLDVRFTWTASATAANYTLEAGQATGAADLANVSVGYVTAFAASGPPGVYYVRTRAQNACGTSAPSNEVVVTLGAPVQVPQPPTDLFATVVGRNVVIQWTPPTSG
ncbi:MAG: hypothetical protein OEW19_12395, partial [Acidobacteriota bacterium]|nr:hypothetical protein [Acidobacteriota bacterium]